MFGITSNTKVYLRTGATDGRYGWEALRGLTVKVIRQEPMSGHIFCFCNAARNRLRLLWWDGTGYWLATKILARGTFDFPRTPGDAPRMSQAQLAVLLKGVEFHRPNGGVRK